MKAKRKNRFNWIRIYDPVDFVMRTSVLLSPILSIWFGTWHFEQWRARTIFEIAVRGQCHIAGYEA